MRITAKSEYGVLAMIDLAANASRSPVSTREVARRQMIPATFLEQLFVALRRAGLVTARRGARGGFLLGREAERISVLDVVEALEGPLRPTVCDALAPCARSSACAAATVWRGASDALREVFSATTIADLAAAQSTMDGLPVTTQER